MSKLHATVTIGGKSYDFEKLEEAVAIQATLVPETWPLAKREGVKLFLALRQILRLEFERHLAYNFKDLLKTALEERELPGGDPVVPVAFAFKINLSALTVAAINETKMSFSRRFASTGKPQARDLNQFELFDEGDTLGTALDVQSFADEQKPEQEETPKPGEEKPKRGPGRPRKDAAVVVFNPAKDAVAVPLTHAAASAPKD